MSAQLCLGVPELLNEIMLHSDRPKTLLSVALTVSYVSESALSMMWRRWQCHAHPLVALLREEHRGKNEDHVCGPSTGIKFLHIHRPSQDLIVEPGAAQWGRFLRYAECMTVMMLDPSTPAHRRTYKTPRDITDRAFMIMNKYLDRSKALKPFAHVRTLYCRSRDHYHWEYRPSNAMLEFACIVGQSCYSITIARVTIPNQYLARLAASPSLKHLQLFLPEEVMELIPGSFVFPSLTTLTLLTNSNSNVSIFLKSCAPLAITKLEVETYWMPFDTDALDVIIPAIAAICDPNSLRHLALHSEVDWEATGAPEVIEDLNPCTYVHTIVPLAGFRKLQVLRLSDFMLIEEDNISSFSAFIAESFPDIQALQVDPQELCAEYAQLGGWSKVKDEVEIILGRPITRNVGTFRQWHTIDSN